MGTALLVNAYYLQEEATRALRRGRPPRVIDEVFAKARRLGASLVRTHASHADPKKRGDSAMWLDATTPDPIAFTGLDLVVERAHAHGLQLVLVLGNQWDAFGGARVYAEWAGLSHARSLDPRFFTDPRVIELYERHALALLERRSELDGMRYGAHPAIACWELLNEPRGEGLDRSGHTVRAWLDRLGRLVRAHVSEAQRIASGEEGLDVSLEGRDASFWRRVGASRLFRARVSLSLDARSPWIDHPSIHLYPEAWGVPRAHVEEAGVRWIREGCAIARREGKRALIGELGLRRGPLQGGLFDSLEARRAIIRRWLDVARDEGAFAVGPWMLAHDTRPPSWDAYQFYVRDGLPLEHPANDVAPTLAAWARDRDRGDDRGRLTGA